MTTKHIVNKWTEEEQSLLIEDYKNMTIEELCIKFNRTKNSISNRVRWLKSKGVIDYSFSDSPNIYKKYGKSFITKVKKLYCRFGLKGTSEILKTPEQEIKNIAGTLGLEFKLGKKFVSRRINMESFLKFEPESCYLTGFIWGDGHVSKSGHSTTINIESNDAFNISPFLFKYGNWGICERNRKNRKPQICFYNPDKVFHTFLCNSGFLEKKNQSAYEILNKIPKDKWAYWFRGFFDADGHITFEEDECGNRKKISFSISSSYDQNWDFFIDLLKELQITEYTIYRHVHKKDKGRFSAKRMNNFSEIKKLLDYIYKDNTNICLGRKYLKYIKMLENYDFRLNHNFFKFYDK